MKEEERIKFVEGLNIVLEHYDLYQEKNKQLLELTGEEKVKKYIELKDEINQLRLYGTFGSKEKIIDEFWNTAKMEFSECRHEIWCYVGSYILNTGDGQSSEIKCNDENHKHFSYNKYQCIECEKIICEKDFKKFEQEHLILKTKGDILPYLSEYVNLLIEHSVEETQNILVKKYGVKK